MRRVIRWASYLLLPPVAIAGHAQTGVIYGNGSVYVNGAQLTNSSAVMPGDVIQTKDAGVAQVSTTGSNAAIQSNTIVRFQSAGIALDRGTVSMATGQFDVIRASGAIQIFARKNSITISCGPGTPITVKEGQQISRADAADCGVAQKQGGAAAAAKGPILDSPTAEKAGLAVGGGLLGWVLFQADEPVSPSIP